MAEVKKYFVARGPFHVPAPIIEEGDTVELDSDVAAQFVREGTLNPVDFTCDDGGNPVVDAPATDPTPDPVTPDPVVDPTPDSQPVVDPTQDPAPADPSTDPAAPADGAPADGE